MKRVFYGLIIAMFVTALSITATGDMTLLKAEKSKICDTAPGPWFQIIHMKDINEPSVTGPALSDPTSQQSSATTMVG